MSDPKAGGNVRLRRLKSDFERLAASLSGKKRIQIVKTLGNPPEKYQLEYHVKSLVQVDSGIRERPTHQVEIVLTRAYPRQAPQCRMLTPVFHPNIAPHAICVGDHWAASETLGALVSRIGEMLAFQSYNLKSPLNGEAARWVAENEESLPLDDFDFSSLVESEGVATSLAAPSDEELAATQKCANCGTELPREQLETCAARHLACKDCIVPCSSCDRVVCLRCRTETCGTSNGLACMDCLAVCPGCSKHTCGKHRARCAVCSREHCDDCNVVCLRCKKAACMEHLVPVPRYNGHICQRCASELRAARAAAPRDA